MKPTRKGLRKKPPDYVAGPSFPGSSQWATQCVGPWCPGAPPILFKRNARRLAISDCKVLNSKISCRLLHHEAALFRQPFCLFSTIGSGANATCVHGRRTQDTQREIEGHAASLFLMSIASAGIIENDGGFQIPYYKRELLYY